jgi:hypothetical protein
MGKFKRFIAMLFDIRPEDLPQEPGEQKQTRKFTPYTQAEIKQLIQQQILQPVKGSIFSVVQSAIEKQGSGQKDAILVEIRKQKTSAQKNEPPVEEIQESSGQVEVQSEPLIIGQLTHGLASIAGKQIRLGIDFGTTTTSVSIKLGDDLPIALPIGNDGISKYIPSVVYFAHGTDSLEGRATVGEEAESYNDPLRTIRSVKRCFACMGTECLGEGQHPHCQGDGRIHLAEEEPIWPSFVAQLIVKEALQRTIRYVRDRWQIELTQENVGILPVNFGCGAKFDLSSRQILCDIATELGFKDFSIQNVVEEPILAGFAFSRFSKNAIGRSLIYDFGGGTFDAAIIEVDEEEKNRRVTILATSADNWLGGDDIDNIVYEYFLEQISSSLPGQSSLNVVNSLGAIDASRIRQRAKEAKEHLSENETYDVTFVSPKLGLLDLHLDRTTFESLLIKSDLVKRSLEVVRHACQLVYVYDEACLTDQVNSQKIIGLTLAQASEKIDHVVLVGGVTKIPYVRRHLEEVFGLEKITRETVIDPISAVAVGGAYEHDPGHYSIVVPPIGFSLTYQSRGKEVKDYILKPYDYIDFNRYWATAAVGSFTKSERVLEDRPEARLWLETAGEKEPKLLKKWSKLEMGDWELTIRLDGSIGFHKTGQSVTILPADLPKHPRQQAIIDAREARIEKKRLEAKKGWSLEKDMKSLLVDP